MMTTADAKERRETLYVFLLIESRGSFVSLLLSQHNFLLAILCLQFYACNFMLAKCKYRT